MPTEDRLLELQQNLEANRRDWQVPGLTVDQRLDRFIQHFKTITKHGGGADLNLIRREVRELLVHVILEARAS